MGKKAQKANHKERFYHVTLRVKGSLKNDMLRAAEKNDLSLSQYIQYCVFEHMRSERGIPAPGNAQFALADPMEHLTGYLRGEEILMPCGQKECDMKIIELNDMQFCDTCNVRVR
jgi:hypothetical protein